MKTLPCCRSSYSTLRPYLTQSVVLIVILSSVLVLSGCQHGKPGASAQAGGKEAKTAEAGDGAKDKKKEDTAIPVEVAVAARREVAASYSGTAALEAPSEAQVVAKTSGVMVRLLTEEGDRVKAGTVLARIDPERAQLELQRAEAALRKLESEHERSKELFARKLVAAEAHERIRSDLQTQRAQYELAKLELSYTNVAAPIDGVVAERLVKPGNLIQLNQPMFRIVNTDRLEAVLNVPERELATMKADLPVVMQVDAIPGASFEGRIVRVSPVIDPASGTFRVRSEFVDSSGRLKPGMFGRIGVVYDRRANALTVPREALIEGEGEMAVFVARDGKAVRVPVKLGYLSGGVAEVLEGLQEGEQVVTTGKVALRDGADLRVLEPETSTPATTAATASTQP